MHSVSHDALFGLFLFVYWAVTPRPGFCPGTVGPLHKHLSQPHLKTSGKFDSKGSTNSSSQVRKALTPHYTYLLGSSQGCIPLIFNPLWSSPPAERGRGKSIQLSLVPLHGYQKCRGCKVANFQQLLEQYFLNSILLYCHGMLDASSTQDWQF